MNILTLAPSRPWEARIRTQLLEAPQQSVLAASHGIHITTGAAQLFLYADLTELENLAHLFTCAANQAKLGLTSEPSNENPL